MAMSPKEMIEFFGSRFESSQKGLDVGKSTSNYQLVVFNYDQGFKNKLMQGLISWRIEASSPKEYLRDAVKIANEAVTYLTNASPKNNIAIDFPIEIASILSYLVSEPFSMPQYTSKGIVFDRLLSFELAKSLQGQNNETGWNNILSNQKANKRIDLAKKTYSVYKEILFTKELGRISLLVEEGEELFKKRSNDAFYICGEGIEGGGPDNDVTIDYRLAAVLKFVAYEKQSIHKWLWD